MIPPASSAALRGLVLLILAVFSLSSLAVKDSYSQPCCRELCLVKVVAEEGWRTSQGSGLGGMLLPAKPGLQTGCCVLGRGSSDTGPRPASSALESSQSDAPRET